MTLHIVGWAVLAWIALGAVRTLLPLASDMDRIRRDAPLRSSQRYFYLVIAAVIDATGAICMAVAMYAMVGFIATAVRSILP